MNGVCVRMYVFFCDVCAVTRQVLPCDQFYFFVDTFWCFCDFRGVPKRRLFCGTVLV